jgi:hypothetical protein
MINDDAVWEAWYKTVSEQLGRAADVAADTVLTCPVCGYHYPVGDGCQCWPDAPENVEVFFLGASEFDVDDAETWMGERAREAVKDDNEPASLAGWWWWPCHPGCLPDSEAMGPFETEPEAIEDARGDDEDEEE